MTRSGLIVRHDLHSDLRDGSPGYRQAQTTNDATEPCRIKILKTRAEVESLRVFWDSCHPCRDADLDFFLFIAELYAEAQHPHVVVLYRGEVPEALLAARLETGQVPVKLGYFALPVPKMRVLQIVHGGWLGDLSEANADQLVDSLVNSLASGEADVVSLHYPDLSSPLARSARALPSTWCSDHLLNPQERRVCDLSEVEGSFLANLSQNERYQQRKRSRKIVEAFPDSRIECFTVAGDVDRLMRDAEIIAAKSYQRGLRVGFSDTPTIRSRLQFEAAQGWMRGYILYLDDQPCAFWIGSLRHRVFLSDYLSFDAAYANYAPGMYLIVKVIQGLQAADAIRLVDFGIGDAAYKERLASRHWQESNIYIFAPRMKAVATNLLRTSVGLMNLSAKRLLRLSWLTPLKRVWRARKVQG